MFELENLIRKNIRKLKPYSSARDEFSGEEALFFDANENPFGSPGTKAYNRYPDPLQKKLKEKIAVYKGVRVEEIFLGNGSDEAIDLLIRAFCNPGIDEILILPPTYGMYQVSAEVNDVKVRRVPLTTSFQPDISVLNVVFQESPHLKICFLCSPNNPTGNLLDLALVKEILLHFSGIVVIDEAYIDYALEKSYLSLLEQYPNLVVLQTFSKAWGLANIRLGIAFSQKSIIEILTKIKPPYNINGVTQELALIALSNQEEKDKMVRATLEERERLKAGLLSLPFVEHLYPSAANFLLVRMKEAKRVYEKLKAASLIVRDRSSVPLCEGCLRITVGTFEENQKLLKACEKIEI